jgi:L-fuconolactonase
MTAMRIDSHQHFWTLSARRGHWPPASLAAIHRDFAPADLLPELAASRIDGTVLVQSLPTPDDTRVLLDLARRHSFVRGVVGWTDLAAPDAPGAIAALAREPALRGLRPMLHDLDDPDWIADPGLDPAIDAMTQHGLVLDALVRTEHLPALLGVARAHPGLPLVIDHGAKPDIAAGIAPGWRDGLAALSELPQVTVKLSGLLTEAGAGASPDVVAPVVAALLALFGPDRVLWGSDWPVLGLAGTYAGWLSLCQSLVPARHHDAVFGGNACRIYRLTPIGDQPSTEGRA